MSNYDPVTGEALTEEALLQVNPNPDSGKKKSKLPLMLGLGLGGVLLVVLLVVLLGNLLGSPVKKLQKGLSKTVSSLSASDTAKVLDSTLQGGSVSLKLDLSKAEELMEMMSGYPQKLDAKVDLAAFFKKDGSAISLNAKLDDKSLMDLMLIGTDSDLAVSSTALFSKTNYGVNLKNMAKNLPNSVFNPENDSRYAIPQELYDYLLSYNKADYEKIEKEGKAVLEQLYAKFFTVLEKHGKVSKGSEKVSLAGKEYNTTKISVELDAKALKKVGQDMVEYLRKDKDVSQLISDWGKQMENVVQMNGGGSFDLKEQFYDSLDDLKEQIEDWEAEDDISLTISGFLKGDTLVQLQLDAKEDDDKNTIRFTLGPDPKNPQEITFYTKDEYGKSSITYLVGTDTNALYEATITAKTGSNTLGKAKISWDKKEGEFRVKLEVMGQEASLTALVKKDGKTWTIEPQKLVDFNNNSLSLKWLSFTIKESDSFPSLNKYTDLLTLKEEEMDELLEDFSKTLQELNPDSWLPGGYGY